MLWARGELVPDDALSVSVLDRTFEHGLGLFETFRTWNGHPTLLDRHVERLKASARALGLPLEPGQLPGSRDVALLIAANRDVIPRRSGRPTADHAFRRTGDHAVVGFAPVDDGRPPAPSAPDAGRDHFRVFRGLGG